MATSAIVLDIVALLEEALRESCDETPNIVVMDEQQFAAFATSCAQQMHMSDEDRAAWQVQQGEDTQA